MATPQADNVRWATRRGQVYSSREVTDRHLRNAHRLFAEQGEDPTLSPANAADLRRLVAGLAAEIERRDLRPLPTRTPEQRQAASRRRAERAAEDLDWLRGQALMALEDELRRRCGITVTASWWPETGLRVTTRFGGSAGVEPRDLAAALAALRRTGTYRLDLILSHPGPRPPGEPVARPPGPAAPPRAQIADGARFPTPQRWDLPQEPWSNKKHEHIDTPPPPLDPPRPKGRRVMLKDEE